MRSGSPSSSDARGSSTSGRLLGELTSLRLKHVHHQGRSIASRRHLASSRHRCGQHRAPGRSTAPTRTAGPKGFDLFGDQPSRDDGEVIALTGPKRLSAVLCTALWVGGVIAPHASASRPIRVGDTTVEWPLAGSLSPVRPGTTLRVNIRKPASPARAVSVVLSRVGSSERPQRRRLTRGFVTFRLTRELGAFYDLKVRIGRQTESARVYTAAADCFDPATGPWRLSWMAMSRPLSPLVSPRSFATAHRASSRGVSLLCSGRASSRQARGLTFRRPGQSQASASRLHRERSAASRSDRGTFSSTAGPIGITRT